MRCKNYLCNGLLTLFLILPVACSTGRVAIEGLQTGTSIANVKADDNATNLKNLNGGFPTEQTTQIATDADLESQITTNDFFKLKQRANDFFIETRPEAPNWKEARIGDNAYPLYRPDISGVAYYIFPVVRGSKNDPAGHILLATDRHDYPVVQWSSHGNTDIEHLALEAKKTRKTPFRFYLLDVLSFAAEDHQGNLIAQSGASRISMPGGGWSQFKKEYAKKREVYLLKLRAQAENDWKYLDAPPSQKKVWCGPWEYHYAGKDEDQRFYKQLSAGVGPNNSDCASGCGATAWAMLFGWIDHRASMGDSAWPLEIWGYAYLTPSQEAPSVNDEDVQSMTWEISNYLENSCVPGEQGFIRPSKMKNAAEYLRKRISYARWTLKTEWTALSIPNNNKRDLADKVIRSGRPAIIQLGWKHYALAYGYRKKTCAFPVRDKHEFKINQGQGGGISHLIWISNSTSFVGHVDRTDTNFGIGSYWQPCRLPPNECDQGLICYEDRCRRYPAEGEPCFTWVDKPQCTLTLQCVNSKCARPSWAGKCTECVPGESNCNVDGCPLGQECEGDTNPQCIGGSSVSGNYTSTSQIEAK